MSMTVILPARPEATVKATVKGLPKLTEKGLTEVPKQNSIAAEALLKQPQPKELDNGK
jgi:hypothetical protein